MDQFNNPAATLVNPLSPAQAQQALVASAPGPCPAADKRALISAVEYALSQEHETRGLVVVATAYPVTQLAADLTPYGRSYRSAQEGYVTFYTRHGEYKPSLAYTEQGTLLSLGRGSR